jgi:hypothetical protein
MPTKKHKASILAVTLIILGIVLASALSVSLVAVKQRQASLGSGKSNLAFQNADTGVEKVMEDIMKNSDKTVGDLNGFSGGKIMGDGYKVELKDKDGNIITNSSTKISDIFTMKSTGIGAEQESRAIEAAVAANVQVAQGLYTSSGSGPLKAIVGDASDFIVLPDTTLNSYSQWSGDRVKGVKCNTGDGWALAGCWAATGNADNLPIYPTENGCLINFSTSSYDLSIACIKKN